MIDEELLQKLAILARIKVQPQDVPARLADFQGILDCISELNSIQIPDDFQFAHTHSNITREDIIAQASPDTVGRIISAFPDSVDTHLSVPKVL